MQGNNGDPPSLPLNPQEEVAPSEAEAVPAEAEVPVPSESVPIVEEPVAPVVETNGTSEAVPETNGNGVAEAAVEPIVEADAVEKRKSEVGGEGDGPDSTDAAPVKKAKVDDEVSAEEAVPVVEASV